MKKLVLLSLCCLLVGLAVPVKAATITVNPADPWQGWMNVSELPSNGGAYLWGSGWGTADLVATFAGPVLSLSPNTIGDPNEYWYQCAGGATPPNCGGPGAPGNKIMEANLYVDTTGVLSGTNVTFTGLVLSNTLTSAHASVAFIKDFAPDYSSFDMMTTPLTPGVFSLTMPTLDDPARHVQYGFMTTGVNVWVTDVAPYGSVQVTSNTATPEDADFNNSGMVDGADFLIWQQGFNSGTTLAQGDANGDNLVNAADLTIWQNQYAGPPLTALTSAVPEPSALLLGTSLLVCLCGVRKR